VTLRVTYAYDPLDRRIRSEVDPDGDGPAAPQATWTAHDGHNPYADFAGAGALQTRYLHADAVDALLARTTSGGATAWYLPDRLGSVRAIADAAGAVVNRTSYDAFGRVSSETNPQNGDRFKFTGRELDPTGLQHHRARPYDPVSGRWLREDPLGLAAGDPNLDRYVANQPTHYVDPTGLYGEGPEGDPYDVVRDPGIRSMVLGADPGYRQQVREWIEGMRLSGMFSDEQIEWMVAERVFTEHYHFMLGARPDAPTVLSPVQRRSWDESVTEIQDTYETLSYVDPTGFVFDGANAVISLLCGRWQDSLVFAAAVVPWGEGFKHAGPRRSPRPSTPRGTAASCSARPWTVRRMPRSKPPGSSTTPARRLPRRPTRRKMPVKDYRLLQPVGLLSNPVEQGRHTTQPMHKAYMF
jgi:RHS repeat-associated protein